MAGKSKSSSVLCHYCTTDFDKNSIYFVMKWAYDEHKYNWDYGVACCVKCLDKHKGEYNSIAQEPRKPKSKKEKK